MTILIAIGLVALAVVLAIIGGALTGIKIAGKYMGNDLAAMLGGCFGPTAVLPATVIGLVILEVLK
ncbi:MAG: hypothetical protein Q7S51_02040 [Gallionellaceae bacterium]|nr:hypothetical protein [Gallionellaceae bacterium]